jgi:hypothetical protein
MPIRINLLAEDQAAEEMRRKDPVKRSIWVAGFVVFLVALWGLTVFLKITIANAELTHRLDQWKSMEKAVREVEDERKRALETEQKLWALAQFSTNRFLWANALNALQQTCVDNVQLVRLKSEQSYVPSEPSRLPTNQMARGAATAKGGAGAVERIMVQLDGRDFGPQPGEQVARYREALAGSPFFQAVLQKTNSVLLTGLSPRQVDSAKKTGFVVFGLQLNFQEKERRLHD